MKSNVSSYIQTFNPIIDETALLKWVWTKQLPSVLTWLKVNQKPKFWVEDVLLGTKENNNPIKQTTEDLLGKKVSGSNKPGYCTVGFTLVVLRIS